MALVIVEREFDQPVSVAELQAQEDAFAWCLSDNEVTFLHTYVALDNRKLVCVYEAPDAEAVRRTQRQAKMPVTKLWVATSVMRASGRTPRHDRKRAFVVVERTLPEGITMAQVQRLEQHSKWCFEAHHIDLFDTYVTPDIRTTICAFAAPDAESVRQANLTLKLPADHIWPAQLFQPTPD